MKIGEGLVEILIEDRCFDCLNWGACRVRWEALGEDKALSLVVRFCSKYVENEMLSRRSNM